MRVIEVTRGFNKGLKYIECETFEESLTLFAKYHKNKDEPQPLPEGHIWFNNPSEFGLKPVSGYPVKEITEKIKKDRNLTDFS